MNINSWGPVFKLSFDVMVLKEVSSYYSSILAFKGNGGSSNDKKYGDRAPAVFYKQGGYLRFTNAVSGKANHWFDRKIELGKWNKIEIEQVSLGGNVGLRYLIYETAGLSAMTRSFIAFQTLLEALNKKDLK